MTDRSDEVERVQDPPPSRDVTRALAVVAKLRPGFRERASEIIAKGAPFDLGEADFRRHSVLLAEEAAVFFFEARGSKGLSASLSTTPLARPRSVPGGHCLKGHLRLRVRSSTGKPARRPVARNVCGTQLWRFRANGWRPKQHGRKTAPAALVFGAGTPRPLRLSAGCGSGPRRLGGSAQTPAARVRQASRRRRQRRESGSFR